MFYRFEEPDGDIEIIWRYWYWCHL